MAQPPQEDDPLAAATPAMKAIVAEWGALGGRSPQGLSAAEARRLPGLGEAARSLVAKQARPAPPSRVPVESRDLEYNGPGGAQLLRVYRPATAGDRAGVVLYFHGGAFVTGSVERYEASAIALARKSGALVAAAAYRQAPEHPFPAAHEDAWAAWRWLTENAAGFGGDPRRLAVCGECSGGNLAAWVSVRARDEGRQHPLHQVLLYPIAGTAMNNYSYNAYGSLPWFGEATMKWVFAQLGGPEILTDRRLNLGNVELANLPRTTVITAGIDPVMFEGKLLAHKIEAENVPTRHQNFEGVVHDFFGLDALLPEARRAQDMVAEQLEAAFRSVRRAG